MYVLMRVVRKVEFVAGPGFLHAYTDKLQEAQTFTTREEAERRRCGREKIREIAEVMRSERGGMS